MNPVYQQIVRKCTN